MLFAPWSVSSGSPQLISVSLDGEAAHETMSEFIAYLFVEILSYVCSWRVLLCVASTVLVTAVVCWLTLDGGNRAFAIGAAVVVGLAIGIAWESLVHGKAKDDDSHG